MREDDADAVNAGREALEKLIETAKIPPEKKGSVEIALLHTFYEFLDSAESNPRIRVTSPPDPDDIRVPPIVTHGLFRQGKDILHGAMVYLAEKYDAKTRVLTDEEEHTERMEVCRRIFEYGKYEANPSKACAFHAVLLCAETGPLSNAPEHGSGMLKYPNGAKFNYMMTEHFNNGGLDRFLKNDGTLDEIGRDMLTFLKEKRGHMDVVVAADGKIQGLSKTNPDGMKSLVTPENYNEDDRSAGGVSPPARRDRQPS